MGAREKDEDFKKSETELEKLIREVKEAERDQAEETKTAKKARDHITDHFDQSTVKLKPKSAGGESMLSETLLRSIFSSFGIIDGVLLRDGSAYVMFRYRDSALKALRSLEEVSDDRTSHLTDFKLKLVSTSKAQKREVKDKHKQYLNDPIETLKAEMKVKMASRVLGKINASLSLAELEAAVIARIRAKREALDKARANIV